jgi:hypothetical protein
MKKAKIIKSDFVVNGKKGKDGLSVGKKPIETN